jgi:phosphoserine phosphatase RsbU/P
MPITPRLDSVDMEMLLGVTRLLAAPFELQDMLVQVTQAACRVLHAERSSIWLVDTATGDLVLETANGLDQARIPLGQGLIGACARDRQVINVQDCYADPRFDPSVDRSTGYVTRCSLTLPLADTQGRLVGVMQLLNKDDGVFGAGDVPLAQALAAQCAVALARVRMTAQIVQAEKARQELELARVVQMSALPRSLPVLPGYGMDATFRPAAETGGDTYDLALVDGQLLVVLADATGHGIAPALSVAQMQAMLRMALRLGTGLARTFQQVNNQLAETLPEGHFVTAFVGLIDPRDHRLRFISGGQGPILHYEAARDDFTIHKATSFPLGADRLDTLVTPVEVDFGPGDCLVLLSDGVYEWADPTGRLYGRAPVEHTVRRMRSAPLGELSAGLLRELHAFARGTPQEDDITMVLVRRDPSAG